MDEWICHVEQNLEEQGRAGLRVGVRRDQNDFPQPWCCLGSDRLENGLLTAPTARALVVVGLGNVHSSLVSTQSRGGSSFGLGVDQAGLHVSLVCVSGSAMTLL